MSNIWKNKYRQQTQTWSEKTSSFITTPDTVTIDPMDCTVDPDATTIAAHYVLYKSPGTDYPDLTHYGAHIRIQATKEVRRVLMRIKGMSII
tara:strand:- start:248 stop:523 length:276 start_codon:yes stop_codon:yes gene_type:complete